MQNKLKRQKLMLFSLLLLLLFSYPVITIPDKKALLAGIPVLYVYIFFVWIMAIIVLFTIAEGKSRKTGE